MIVAITRVAANRYAVEFESYHCTYLVDLGVRESNVIGPAQYYVKQIAQPTCERP